MGDIAHYKPFTVLKVPIPAFISQLPSNYESLKLDSIHGAKYIKILEALSEICIEQVLFESLVPEILAKLNGVQTCKYLSISHHHIYVLSQKCPLDICLLFASY